MSVLLIIALLSFNTQQEAGRVVRTSGSSTILIEYLSPASKSINMRKKNKRMSAKLSRLNIEQSFHISEDQNDEVIQLFRSISEFNADTEALTKYMKKQM
jgi:hypothetical protein